MRSSLGGWRSSCFPAVVLPAVLTCLLMRFLSLQDGQEWVMSSWEQDEEIVTKLKSWTDHLMARRFK